ncbi:MAG: exonuclease domain-containing protein [Ruminococcus sp.]|nr:exonuclease domain-containing protein [Ruminococcus sp.]
MSDNKNKYLCFADFEFTCGYCIKRYESEILSVGIVICDESYKIKERFYCTCRPHRFPKLTKQCIKLTKLTQNEIDCSPDSNNVMKIVVDLTEKYMIDDIYVWGNFDEPALFSDIKQHMKFKQEYGSIQKVRKRIFDIQNEITKKLKLPEPVNIGELATAFDYTPDGTFHNALNDAMALYVIYKAVYTENLNTNKKLAVIRRQRLDKIEQRRIEAEKKQKETAFSLPLSDEEKLYYEEIKKDSVKLKYYIFVRSRFVSTMNNNPDKSEFLLLHFRQDGHIKVIPKSKYNYTLQNLSEEAIGFERDNFSELILKECMSKDKVKV